MKNKMYKRIAISEIGSIVSGATPKTSDATNYGGDIPWLTPADLSGYTNKYIERGARNISKKGYDSCSTQIMPAGSILFSSRAPIGYVAIAANPICTNQGFKSIVPNKNVDSEFLFYQLKFLKNQIADLGRGTTFKEISGKTLGSVEIVLPDLKEQKRIVSEIEELFSELDSAVETLKKTKEQLAVYRQSVLKEAFAQFSHKEKIKDLSEFVTSGSRGWAQYYSDDGARFIRITDLTRDRIVLKNDDIQYVALPDNVEGKRSRLKSNDILVSITADLGSIALIPKEIQEAYINQHIALVRLSNPEIAKFTALYLKSDWGQKDLLKNKRGGGKMGLGLDDIRNTPIPVVSTDIANKIVSQIESRLSACENIERTVNEALIQADAMRQSILKKAFEGEL